MNLVDNPRFNSSSLFFQTKLILQMMTLLYQKGMIKVGWLFKEEKKKICHVALSQRSESRFNISGSKNISLQVSSGSVLKAERSLFA